MPEYSVLVAKEDWYITLRETHALRQEAESWLLHKVSTKNDSVAYRLSQISVKIGMVSPLDLIRMAWNEASLVRFNPFLGSEARMEVRVKIIEWMMLCVLEDELNRMLRIQDEHGLITELECVRKWDAFKHPRWLAFEVEQEIQIRPYQFIVVQQLLDNPGTITQLSMGLGKTRVLLPMLLLELAQSKTSIVRINVLPSIINEAIDYYRSALVASVQNLRVFSLPFHRDTPLGDTQSQLLSQVMQQCRDLFGCLIVTPQDRNSLLMKQLDDHITVACLEEPFTDVLDESDAILDYEFQLVYATGTQNPLPDGRHRWLSMMVFLQALVDVEFTELLHLLCDPTKVHKECRSPRPFP